MIFIAACSVQEYLPPVKEIGSTVMGSHISLVTKSGHKSKGELIAVDTSQIVVLVFENRSSVQIPIHDIKSFKLRYAKAKHYWPSILLGSLISISHGWGAFFTLPLNLIVTSAVSISGADAHILSQKRINYEKLSMFARFPQGIPPNVMLEEIR